jgi:hypothetical protein
MVVWLPAHHLTKTTPKAGFAARASIPLSSVKNQSTGKDTNCASTNHALVPA